VERNVDHAEQLQLSPPSRVNVVTGYVHYAVWVVGKHTITAHVQASNGGFTYPNEDAFYTQKYLE
jgi:hypothetical protein